jgi:hypothetical protein
MVVDISAASLALYIKLGEGRCLIHVGREGYADLYSTPIVRFGER